MKSKLTVASLCKEAKFFAKKESVYKEPSIYGVTDGKAIGTYFEHKFRSYLLEKYKYVEGNTAKGIDFPELGVDMKVTSIKQPQSSCPYRSARQKVLGLGYSLLIFVYEKTDDPSTSTGTLNIHHSIFIEKNRTADFQTTSGLRQIVKNDGNIDDLVSFMLDRNLPLDEVGAVKIAEELLKKQPEQGYLTISNALQWRLQYQRVINQASKVDGIQRLR